MTEPRILLDNDGSLNCIMNSLSAKHGSYPIWKGVQWGFRSTPLGDASNSQPGQYGWSFEIGSNENVKSRTWLLSISYSIELFESDDLTTVPIFKWSKSGSATARKPTVRVAIFSTSACPNEIATKYHERIPMESIVINKVTHCRFTITNVRLKGIPVRRVQLAPVSPLDPKTPHDRVLVVQGVKFYVKSQVLSMWSGHFDRMFNSEFAEKNSLEIELKDVESEPFLQLLNILYLTSVGPSTPNEKNVESVLVLADRFEIMHAVEKCRNFLMNDAGSTVNAFRLMNLAKTYAFVDVQELALSILTKTPNLTQYIKANSSDYDALDDSALRDVVYAYSLRKS